MIGSFSSIDEVLMTLYPSHTKYINYKSTSKTQRSTVRFSDIEFMERHLDHAQPAYGESVKKAERLVSLGLMKQNENYRTAYCLTPRGRIFLRNWDSNRRPLTRIGKMIFGYVTPSPFTR